MEFRPCRRSSRMPLAIAFSDFGRALPPAFEIATDGDLEILRAAQERYHRQVHWNQCSMAVGLTLGTLALAVAVFAPLPPGCRSWMIAAAVLELGFLPVYLTAARRWLRRLVELIGMDLEHGDIANRWGRVRTLLGAGRVIEDLRTRTIRMAHPGFTGLAELRMGTILNCRFALRSGVLLSVERRSGIDCDSSARRSDLFLSEPRDWFGGGHADVVGELTIPAAAPTIRRGSVFAA